MSIAINIQLDEDAAQIYNRASEEKREKIRLLFSLWLREFEDTTLRSVMDQISDNAEQRDLTPEILESLLNDD
ncbi:MAG TPA: hypothetical protein ENJ93_07795 [Chloroflexi bacterium]|nr:hypothetical protein [Chloroflexota bacterium]